MKIFNNQESLIKYGRSLADKTEVYSFDLFDTLLIRRIHDPDLVKLPVARYISALGRKYGFDFSAEYVQRVRDDLEKKQREETAKNYIDHEACYPVFMHQTLQKLFKNQMSDQLLQEITHYEMKMENAMLVPRKEFLEWLKELHEQGKELLIISDVYLTSDFLKGLVRYAGFERYISNVISSADTYLAKASGEAYKLVLNKFKFDPNKWVHIGDNPISDGLRPTESGIKALIIDDPSEKQRKSIIRRQINYSRGRPFWRGRVIHQLMLPLEKENSSANALYGEGYNFLAPIIGYFIHKIIEKCKEHGISKVFFLSREGLTFKKFWEKSVPYLCPANDAPSIEYLYVSRMALASACCAYQGLTRINADIAFLPSGNKDFRDICRIFKLDKSKLDIFLIKYDLSATTVLSPLHDGYLSENTSKYHALLKDEDFQNEIKRQTRSSNDALQLYLKSVGFFDHDEVALVDIGWLGTIPRFFYEAIKHQESHPRCHNFLFGATRGLEYPTSPKNSIYGLIYDKDKFDFAASCITYSKDFFEEASKAPHATLNGYELKDNDFELIFRNTDDELGKAEKAQDRFYEPLQQGIFDAAEKFGVAVSLMGYQSSDYKAWLNYLIVSKMAFPTTEEVVNIRHKVHLDDFCGKHKPSPNFIKGVPKQLWDASELSLRLSPLLRIRHFLRHMREKLNGC